MELSGDSRTIDWGGFIFDINEHGELVRSEDVEIGWSEDTIGALADLAIKIVRHETINGQPYTERLLLEDEVDPSYGGDYADNIEEDDAWMAAMRREHHVAQLAELDNFVRHFREQAETLPFGE